MSTPSAPQARAFITKLGSTRPLHITRRTRTLGAYLMRAVPARSAARYEHQLQQKPTILGSKGSDMGVGFQASGFSAEYPVLSIQYPVLSIQCSVTGCDVFLLRTEYCVLGTLSSTRRG